MWSHVTPSFRVRVAGSLQLVGPGSRKLGSLYYIHATFIRKLRSSFSISGSSRRINKI